MSDRKLSVVIPVRNMAHHIAACVPLVASDLGPGDEVVVVDDGSTDGSADAAKRAGARVLRNSNASGPYHARNQAVRATTNEIVLFVDARSRARRGLLDAHRALLARPDVALSCTGIEIERSNTLAGRIAAEQDFFRVDSKVTGTELDFFPTVNLGVWRSAFEAVGGFAPIRSGADADLCWRVQASGLGRIAADPRLLMSWIPRERITDLIEQNYRYGKSWVFLQRSHADAFARARAGAVTAVEELAPSAPPAAPDRLASLGAMANNLSFRAGRLRGRWEHRRVQSTSTERAGMLSGGSQR